MNNEEKLKEAKLLILAALNDYEDERLDEAMMLIAQVVSDMEYAKNPEDDMTTWKQLENQSVITYDGLSGNSSYNHCRLYFNPNGRDVVIETPEHKHFSRSFACIEFSQDNPKEA